jgi:hypothetical protein
MKQIYSRLVARLFSTLLVVGFMAGFVACQKADPSPSAIITGPLTGQGSASNPSGPTTSFTGSVNGSSTMTFTGTKNSAGGSTTLTGTNSYYTIKLVFPTTTGPGTYFLSTSGFSASVYDGSNTYVCNASYGSGDITIDSIPSGNYYGSFSFIGELPSHATEDANGNFKKL